MKTENYNLTWLAKVPEIYTKIMDDQSKDIFEKRLLFSLTKNYNHIVDITKMKNNPYKKLHKQLCGDMNGSRELILDGAGIYGEIAIASLPDVQWSCICDRAPVRDMINGIPVITRNEAVRKYPNAIYVITSMVFYQEIEADLREKGIQNIFNLGREVGSMHEGNLFDPKQYLDYLAFDNQEIMIDAGCHNCETVLNYFKYVNTDYKSIYSFEAEPNQADECRKIIKEIGKGDWEIYNYALWDKTDKLLLSSGGAGSAISDQGEFSVEGISLDEFFQNREKPTFIELDIEGAEMNALIGAAGIIKNHSPKLAISIYHKPEDIVEIPAYILSLNQNYRFGLRHYSEGAFETVLYAITE